MRTCQFSYSSNLAVYSTDKALGHQCEMFIIDTRSVDAVLTQEDTIRRIPINGPRISSILWGALDETIITGHEDGELNIWDVRVRLSYRNNRTKTKNVNFELFFDSRSIFFLRLERNSTPTKVTSRRSTTCSSVKMEPCSLLPPKTTQQSFSIASH